MTWVWIEADAAEVIAALARLNKNGKAPTGRLPPPEEPAPDAPPDTTPGSLTVEYSAPPPGFNMAAVFAAVGEVWKIHPEVMRSKVRISKVVEPRYAGMYLAREVGHMQFADIGQVFGGRDHSSVIYGVSQAREKLGADPVFADRLEAARERLMQLCSTASGV